MNQPGELGRALRFGIFEVDLRAREIRKRGLRLNLQEKPFQILEALLERPGELVTRQDLRQRLWPDTHVGFDRSLNTAINKLRQVLGDSTLSPRYVETRARRGYCFIAPVEAAPAAARPSRPTEAVNSIAVLPFENAAGDTEIDYLTDGITESVIDSLSRLPGVRVIARSTVLRFKGRHVDPAEAGRELNTAAVLTGRVGQRGGTVVIDAELVDVGNGWRLWGQQYTRDPANVYAIQDEISRDITDKMRLELTGEERNRLARHSTENSAAYHDYLKGRYYLNRLSEDALRKAVGHFERAIERDPNYALAFAGLADAYSMFAVFSLVAARQMMPKAKAAALKALELDPELADAHASLAGALKSYDWDWSAAEAEYLRALECSSNSAGTHRWYAMFLSALGRTQEGLREMQLALDLDPLSLILSIEMAWIRYMARDYERAAEQSLKALEMEPAFPPAHHALGLAYQHLGKHQEAIAAFKKAREPSGSHPAILTALGYAYASAGLTREASEALAELVGLSMTNYISPFLFAMLSAGMDEKDAAFEWLATAVEERDVWLVWLKQEPRLDPLRSDARFEEIVQRIGF